MSSVVFWLLTLHLNDCDFDYRPLFLVSPFPSLYIHIHICILLLLLYTIFPGTDKTGTGPAEFQSKRLLVPVTQS